MSVSDKKGSSARTTAIVDSGASHNFLVSSQGLKRRRRPQKQISVGTAKGGSMKVKAVGDLTIPTQQGPVDMGEALVIPEDLVDNLISVGTFCDKKRGQREARFTEKSCEFLEDGDVVLVGSRKKGGLYSVSFTTRTAKQQQHALAVKTKQQQVAAVVKVEPKERNARLARRGGVNRISKLIYEGTGVVRSSSTRALKRAQRALAVETRLHRARAKDALDFEAEVKSHARDSPLSSVQPQMDEEEPLDIGAQEAMALHRKLHHLNLKEVKWLVQTGKVSVSEACNAWFAGKTKFGCTHCSFGKTTKKPLGKKKRKRVSKKDREKERGLKNVRRRRVKEVKMGMDLNGPNARGVGSHTGALYALLLRMKKTKFSWLRFVKKKSDVFEGKKSDQ
jgi:hypothetical protein